MDEQNAGGGGEPLQDVASGAERVAREAEAAREENERGMRGGQETDYDFRLPPDVAHADRIRAANDAELAERQAQIAEQQRRAAEALGQSADALERTAEDIRHTEHRIGATAADLRRADELARQVREQAEHAREVIEHTRIPRVDRGPEE